MPQLKKIDLLPVLAILLFALWYAVPSSLFLKPISWKLDANEVTFVRETPYGEVTAKWVSEITLADRDGFECMGSGTAPYQVEPTNVIRYEMGSWATRCIADGPPFTIRLSWSVLLFDVIPLRPVKVTLYVEPPKGVLPALPAICK